MKFTVRVQRHDTPELVAYNRILKRYGTGCYPQNPQEREAHWIVPVGAYVQSKVFDEKRNLERVLTFNLENVGEIVVRKDTMTVERATRLRTLGKKIVEKRAEIREIVEKDLLRVFGKREVEIRFSELRYSFTGLQPIYRTLTRLLDKSYPSYDELLGSGPHYIEQVNSIIDLNYARYTEDKILVPTNKLTELFSEEQGDLDKTCDIVLGLILSTFYYDFRRKMRVAQFVPYVRASTTYYGKAIQFGELISVSEKRLRESVRDYYKGAPLPERVRFAYPVMIRELVNARILDYDGHYITGREVIFNQLIDVRNELPMNEEPFSFQ